MKAILQTINTSRWFLRAFEWGKLLTITGFAQVFVQAVGLACGVLVIRLLPTEEYALYILANTMCGTMAILSDGGISTGVISVGGRVWRDREKLGTVLATGLDLRKMFSIGSLFVAIPCMLLLLRTHHASWLTSLSIVLAVIPAFFAALSGSLLQIAPRLQQDIPALQKNQVISNTIRLLLSSATLLIMPFAFIAILASTISQVWANIRLKNISIKYADWRRKPDLTVRKELLGFVKRLLPSSIYYCISGQITIWLISVFGSTAAIAQVGALARLTMVLTLITVMVNTLVVPRFARLVQKKNVLIEWYVAIQFGLLMLCCFAIMVVKIFPDAILWVLGPNYSNLGDELLLSVIGGCLNLAVAVNYTLNSSRGWLINPVVGILVGIAGIIGGILLVDVSTLTGVLQFNVFTGLVGLLIHPLFGFLKIVRTK